MSNCPFCRAQLARADLESETCPFCNRVLPRDMLATRESDLGPAPPRSESEKGTADEKRVTETLGLAGSSAPRAKAGEPEKAESARDAETRDYGELTPEAAERLSLMWSGSFQPETSPQNTIKAEVQTVGAKANLLIQPRVLREAKPGGAEVADYELRGRLGEGGMGVVLAARQASIDRSVAVKMLKPAGAKEREARAKFLCEAAVTGDLEHPNIVPIYDLGKDQTGALFYSMKHVKGTPWHMTISKKTFPENLEILMKVADAVALAHSREVVHRDLKPDNVMLGDFGEVLLMDWGLAVSLASGTTTTGMAGTPAYMAPELASGPIERIGPASDVYLLGAILYEIVTGRPPHAGKNVLECLFAAAKNEIQPTEKSGELVAIALKALATAPEDRYAGVGEFQAAIREYQSHSESISLSSRAHEDLEGARARDDYEAYARALFGFQEAYSLWEGNKAAGAGITGASLAYAGSALRKGDYDLGASLLDAEIPEHAELLQQIREAQRERDSRQQRLKTAKRVGAGLVLTMLVVVSVAFFWIRTAKLQAEDARDDAQAAQQTAEEAQKTAEEAQKKEAIARKKEEYETYIARIGLTAAKIEENAFDKAEALLDECPAHLRHWEWGRLKYLCTQDRRTFQAQQPLEAVAFAPDGKRLVTGGWGGTARVWDAESGEELVAIPTGGDHVFAVAFSPDGKHVATGTNDPPHYVKIWDAETGALVRVLPGAEDLAEGKPLPGHKDAVLSVVYSRDGKRLLTSSYDNTARLWDLETGNSQAFQGHESWVWSAVFSPDEKRIVTASQDGSAMVWSVETRKAGPPFLGHVGPVYAAAFSPDGEFVATAGYDNRVLLWEPGKVKPFDFTTLFTDERNPPPVYEALEGHTAAVRSVQFSPPDGKWLLSGGNDNTVRVWNAANRTLHKTLRGHAGRVLSCVFAPDGKKVLSGSHDHLAKIWSIAGYEEVRVFKGHGDAVLGASFSADGKQIVSACRDRTAKTWNVESGKEIREFKEGHKFLASSAVFFPDGKKLVTAAVDNTTRVWNVDTGTQLFWFQGTGARAAVALSNHAKWILTGSNDRTAKLWDAETGKLLRTFIGHRSEVTAVAFSPDDRWLLTGDADGRCLLWDAATGEKKWESVEHSRGITAAGFLPGGDYVLTASLDNTVAQWDVKTGRERLDLILKHPVAVTSMALSRDGRRVLTACADNLVRLWDVADGSLIGSLGAGDETVTAVAFAPDGRRAVTTNHKDSQGTVRLWDLQSLQEISRDGGPFLSSSTGDSQAWSAVFSPQGGYVLTVGGNEARLWQARTGRESMRFSPHSSVASAYFSPDGKLIVTSSWDNTAKIWDAQTGRAERKLEDGHRQSVSQSVSQSVNHAVFSPDGSKVLTASDDKTAKLWDAKTRKVLLRFEGHERRVRTAVFSPDGKRVLTACDDKTARIWDAANGTPLQVLNGHEQAVLSAAFSADGTRAITGSADNNAKVWDVSPNQEKPKELFSLKGHTASVTSVAFSPDGRRALTGSQDQTAKMWDARTKEQILQETFTEEEKRELADQGPDLAELLAKEEMSTGKEIFTFTGHSEEVTTVAFSPDSKSVLTGSRDGTLILWPAVDWGQPQ